MDRLRNFLSLLRGQLWPVPVLFTMGAGGLAFVLLSYGHLLTPKSDIWWIFSGDAGTARDLLGSLLSGLMTMTSLVVSVTFVILTLSANQLGPRLILIFMGDRQIQSVLGLFIGTILYVVLVLRTLDDTLGSDGVPHLAVTVASVLTILCLLALLFYIHKIARSIIADNVVEAVWQEFRKTLREILPDRDSQRSASIEPFNGPHWSMGIGKVGYIQVVNYKRLLAIASETDVCLVVKVRAGHYVLKEARHIEIYCAESPSEELCDRLRSAITVGTQRTPAQDPEQGIRQLVEIATRALSPGINDPFTALAVTDRVGAAMEEVFGRGLQKCVFSDTKGKIRVIADRDDIAGLLAAAFNPIRQHGAGDPAILIHLAEVISDLAQSARQPAHRRALLDQLERIAETGELQQFARQDRNDLLAALDDARESLAGASLERMDRADAAPCGR